MAIDIQHPAITRTMRTGYPDSEPEIYGTDFYGNEVYVGDTILVLEDEFFLKDELTSDVIELLEHFGALEIEAK